MLPCGSQTASCPVSHKDTFHISKGLERNQFAFLALTHSWKVLKLIGLLLVSSMVLKEGALLISCSMSWKETFFLPDLPMVLKEVSLPLFFYLKIDSVVIILSSDDFYAIYTRGLERSQLVSVLLSPASCNFGWGLERSLSSCLSDDLCYLHHGFWKESICIALSCLMHWHSHGLEGTGWMVLKGLWCNSLVPQLCFSIYFQARVLKGISGIDIYLVFCNKLGNIFP